MKIEVEYKHAKRSSQVITRILNETPLLFKDLISLLSSSPQKDSGLHPITTFPRPPPFPAPSSPLRHESQNQSKYSLRPHLLPTTTHSPTSPPYSFPPTHSPQRSSTLGLESSCLLCRFRAHTRTWLRAPSGIGCCLCHAIDLTQHLMHLVRTLAFNTRRPLRTAQYPALFTPQTLSSRHKFSLHTAKIELIQG
jgi:hypothetical protein